MTRPPLIDADRPAPRFRSRRLHVAQQYAEIPDPDSAAELTRNLRPRHRRAVLGHE
jgi:hypothetical protein